MSHKKITDPEGSMEELIARAVKAAKSSVRSTPAVVLNYRPFVLSQSSSVQW